MKLADIKPNPDNPRSISNKDLEKLKNSISEFSKMMHLRPLVIDGDNMVLGGNQRLKALKALGYKQIPDEWVKRAEDLTEDEKKRFIIADNVANGEWNYELLKDWDEELLEEWGMLDLGERSEINENEIWDENSEMPDFEEAEKDIKLILYFENEQNRELYCKENNIKVTKKQNNQWIVR